MSINVTVSAQAPENWDSLVETIPGGTLFQTTKWAAFMKDYLKADPVFIKAEDDREVVGLLVAFKMGFGQRKLFEKTLSSLTVPVLKKIKPHYTWKFGPLVKDEEKASEIITSILRKLNKDVKEVVPCIHVDLNQNNIKKSFEERGFEAVPAATFVVDLRNDKETLWKNVKKEARKNVNRCKRDGVDVELVRDEKGLHDYYSLAKEVKETKGIKVYSFENLGQLWDKLGDNINIFLAKKTEKILQV
jgi:hypothetical protein